MAPTPRLDFEMSQELLFHVVFAAKLGISEKQEKSTLCQLIAEEMEIQSTQGMAMRIARLTEDVFSVRISL